MTNEIHDPECRLCGDEYPTARWALGYKWCKPCGEVIAKQVVRTVVPMPKSNYILVTDMTLLKGLNSSHKGGLST
jgi:ribosomal protein L37AE/L43A